MSRVFPRWLLNARPIESLLLRLPIPGWPQLHAGRREVGLVMLFSWIGLLFVGFLLLGSGWGSMALGLAFGVHVWSGIDLIAPNLYLNTPRSRLVCAAAFAALIGFLIYAPANRLVRRWADPINLQTTSGPFQQGDILLVNHAQTTYRPGQLVLFDVGDVQIELNRNHQYIFYTGDRIDRIIAGPGDSVRWDGSKFSINGVVSSIQPLLPNALPPGLETSVPDGKFLIFPSVTPFMNSRSAAGDWLRMSLISTDQIKGIVWLRKNPLLKMKVLK